MSSAALKKLLAASFPAALCLLGLAMVATGLLGRASALELAARTVPILLFVAAMTVVTELADDAGLPPVAIHSGSFPWTGRGTTAKFSMAGRTLPCHVTFSDSALLMAMSSSSFSEYSWS